MDPPSSGLHNGFRLFHGVCMGTARTAVYFFLPMYGRESNVFGSNFRIDILMELHVLRLRETENLIFGCWSVCVYLLSA